MAIIQPKSTRIAAVDVMRALTMTLMLFVNDIAGLQNIPHCCSMQRLTKT